MASITKIIAGATCSYGKLVTVTGTSGLAIVEEPPVLLMTLRMPPLPTL